jgi:SAM-dependent methyltransferase
MSYNKDYYEGNSQDSDRPALWMYERFWRRYLGKGPVLEFGCGVGFFARRLSRNTMVFGLETNQFSINKIQQNAPAVKCLSTTVGLPNESIGSIVALHVFEHIHDDDLVQIGVELNRVLQPGGRILAVMPDLDGRAHFRKGGNWSAFSDSTHINLKGADAWRRFFVEQWKLDVVKSFADGYYDFPYGANRLRSAPADALRAFRTMVQFFLARPLLRPGDGENVVFILEKRL